MTGWTAKLITGSLMVGVLLAALAFMGAGYAPFNNDKVITGVRAAGVPLADMDRKTAVQALEQVSSNIVDDEVNLFYGNRNWQVRSDDLGLSMNSELMVDRAMQAGRNGTFLDKWREKRQVAANGLDIPVLLHMDRELMERYVDGLTTDLTAAPRDARFHVNNDDTITIIPAQDGLKVNYDVLATDLMALSKTRGSLAPVELQMSVVTPLRTTADVENMGLKGLLAVFGTSFDPSIRSRAYNIKVAAAALDGVLLTPGQEFSFNDVVGPRSSEAGYKNAPVIINNEFVDGLGGGVCQVSTTLYNAVLMANLEITSRTNHSLPVSYVPKGRDATVVYQVVDFKFRNSYEDYLYIKCEVQAGNIKIKLYGNTDKHKQVEIHTQLTDTLEPKIVYEKDPNLNNGEQVVKQEGSRGYKVTAERIVWEHGTSLREPLPSSYYHPINRIIAIGTREVTTPVMIPPAEGVEPTEPPDEVAEPEPGLEPVTENGDEMVPHPDSGEKLLPGAGANNGNLEDNHQPGDNENGQNPSGEELPAA